jgi:hypothetical protein
MSAVNHPLSWKNPRLRRGAIALLVLILLTLFLAPNVQRGRGSTYSRAPDGYGAWYAFMTAQGTPIQRWQKPFSELAKHSFSDLSNPTRITLLRVNSILPLWGLNEQEREWVGQGNRLIILGLRSEVTEAQFTTWQPTDVGAVKVDTRRRLSLNSGEESVLSDRFGAIVLRQLEDNGEIIYAVTPHLAANAYQGEPGNYKFLAQFVAREGYELWVDEYIHGYKDADVIAAEVGESWINYLSNTPVMPILIQLGMLLLVLIWAENQRFGSPLPLSSPGIDNSKLYIEALAGVLQKAESSEFILDVVGQEEQHQIQKALGLGSTPLAPEVLLDAWVKQTGRPATELEQVLRPHWQKQRLHEADLIAWIKKVQALHQHLPSSYDTRSHHV